MVWGVEIERTLQIAEGIRKFSLCLPGKGNLVPAYRAEAIVLGYLSFFFAMAAESRTRPLSGFSAMILSAFMQAGWFDERLEASCCSVMIKFRILATNNFATEGRPVDESIHRFDETLPRLARPDEADNGPRLPGRDGC
jgi:hypothetical protein